MGTISQRVGAWFSTGKFVILALLAVIVMVSMSCYILHHRVNGGWLNGPCGDEHWSRASLPVPVYLDESDADWEMDVRSGIALMDPWAALFSYRGLLGVGVLPPDPVIIVTTGNYDDHGVSHVRWNDGSSVCTIRHVDVELPGLLQKGPVRVRSVAHELGHALGLAHSDWETSIMYPVATGRFPFSLSDADRVRLLTAYINPPVRYLVSTPTAAGSKVRQ